VPLGSSKPLDQAGRHSTRLGCLLLSLSFMQMLPVTCQDEHVEGPLAFRTGTPAMGDAHAGGWLATHLLLQPCDRPLGRRAPSRHPLCARAHLYADARPTVVGSPATWYSRRPAMSE
jgi:hypothetical protein